MNYPKPSPSGGTLIRKSIQTLKASGLKLPLNKKVVLAVSGGLDSMALLGLLSRYGRRIVPFENLSVLHINHGWRKEKSDLDEKAVKKISKKLGLPFQSFRVSAEIPKGTSWEEWGRQERKKIYHSLQKKDALIFTAHHGDDLAETLLWRLFTGNAQIQGAGIQVQDQNEIRPFLGVRKSLLKAFLKEEKLKWRIDSTNHEGRFLRSKMRCQLLPEIEKLFPRAIEHLMRLGLEAQSQKRQKNKSQEPLEVLFSMTKTRIKKAHWDAAQKLSQSTTSESEIHLSQGWKLIKKQNKSTNKKVQWVLENSSLAP